MTNDEMKTFLTLGWGKFGTSIQAAWCKYNDLYFNNTLKPLPIVPTAILPYGHCVAYTRGSRGIANHIMLAAPKQGEVLVADKGVLLHEMIHQHLFETGKDPSHAGKPWCDCIVRLNKQIGRKAIHAAPDKFGKDADRRSFRFKPVCEATGLASLSQQDDCALAALGWHQAGGAIGTHRPGSAVTFSTSGFGNSSTARSSNGRPSAASMYGKNAASKFRMPASIAVTDPLIQSLKIELTAMWPCSRAFSS